MHLLPEGSDKFLHVPSQINNIQRAPVKRWEVHVVYPGSHYTG